MAGLISTSLPSSSPPSASPPSASPPSASLLPPTYDAECANVPLSGGMSCLHGALADLLEGLLHDTTVEGIVVPPVSRGTSTGPVQPGLIDLSL